MLGQRWLCVGLLWGRLHCAPPSKNRFLRCKQPRAACRTKICHPSSRLSSCFPENNSPRGCGTVPFEPQNGCLSSPRTLPCPASPTRKTAGASRLRPHSSSDGEGFIGWPRPRLWIPRRAFPCRNSNRIPLWKAGMQIDWQLISAYSSQTGPRVTRPCCYDRGTSSPKRMKDALRASSMASCSNRRDAGVRD